MLEIWMQPVHRTVIYIKIECFLLSFVFFVSVSVHHLALGGHDRLLPSGVMGWLATPILKTTPRSGRQLLVIGQRLVALNSLPSRRHSVEEVRYCESAAEGELRTRTSVGTVSRTPTSAGIFHLFLIQRL